MSQAQVLSRSDEDELQSFAWFGSRQAIHAIETGKYDPGLPLGMKIARVFQRRVEEIFELGDND